MGRKYGDKFGIILKKRSSNSDKTIPKRTSMAHDDLKFNLKKNPE